MSEHQHEFKETKVNISNGQRFVTETCACGATRGYSKSAKGLSKFHKTYGKIELKKPE